MEQLINIDTGIFLFFNSMYCGFADRFMQLFSERFIWVPMYATLLFVIIRNYGWRKALFIIAGSALAIAMTDQLCASLIRPVVQRLRPANPANPLSDLVHIVNGYRGGNYGFPSCHAANTFALVGLMVPLIRNRRFTATVVTWALVNCYSRIHLGVHYPGDLLAGGLIGFMIGYLCYYLVRLTAFSGKTPQAVNSETSYIYFASPIFTYIPMLRLSSFQFRHTDFVTIAASTTVAAIALAAI